MRRGHDTISVKDALLREATQDRTGEALRALRENAQKALSLSLAAHDTNADVSSVEAALLETLEQAIAMAALVDAGRGGRTDYAEAIRALTERLKKREGKDLIFPAFDGSLILFRAGRQPRIRRRP